MSFTHHGGSFALALAERLPCACVEVTRLHLGPFSLPVGPSAVVITVTAALFAPALLFAWRARRREARAAARLLTELAGDGAR